VTLQPEKHWEYTQLLTCNLSISREAVPDAGSFDAQFRVAEDSDLGLRLSRKGFWVNYIPEARAIHQHLPFIVRDLIHRAEFMDGRNWRCGGNIRRCLAMADRSSACWTRLRPKRGAAWCAIAGRKLTLG
jgi:glycosyl transferase family 2